MSFRTDRRYYLTSDGRAVEEGDADAQSLLFGIDAEVSAADAKKYGIANPAEVEVVSAATTDAEDDAGSTKAKSAAPANKAKATGDAK